MRSCNCKLLTGKRCGRPIWSGTRCEYHKGNEVKMRDVKERTNKKEGWERMWSSLSTPVESVTLGYGECPNCKQICHHVIKGEKNVLSCVSCNSWYENGKPYRVGGVLIGQLVKTKSKAKLLRLEQNKMIKEKRKC